MVSTTVSLESIPLDTSRPSRPMSGADLSGDAPKRMTYDDSKAGAAQDTGVNTARNVAFAAAQNAASQGLTHAKASFTEVRRYAQQSPNGVRAISFCIALALFIFSILGMINVFDAVFKPHQYLFACTTCSSRGSSLLLMATQSGSGGAGTLRKNSLVLRAFSLRRQAGRSSTSMLDRSTFSCCQRPGSGRSSTWVLAEPCASTAS